MWLYNFISSYKNVEKQRNSGSMCDEYSKIRMLFES